MAENVDNSMLEHLNMIQVEPSRLATGIAKIDGLAKIETSIARIGRDNAHAFEEQIEDRLALDALKERSSGSNGD